jgi:hypothetical protein
MQTVSQYIIERGATSVILHVFIEASNATTGAGMTGNAYNTSGLVITAHRPGEASVTVYSVAASTIEDITTIGTFAAPTATKIRFKAVDGTNAPGWYELHLDDSLLNTTSSRRGLTIHLRGITNMRPATISIQLVGVDLQTPINAISVRSSTAQAGATRTITLDASASSTDDLYTLCNILTTGGTGAGQVRRIVEYVGSTKIATVDRPWATNPDSTTTFAVLPDSISRTSDVLRTATAQAGASGSITLDGSATATDDYYNRLRINIVAGTGAGQSRKIADYVGSTKVATIDANWITNPDSTSVFDIVSDGDLSTTASVNLTAAAVDAIWDEDIVAAHGTANTAGYLLSILTGRTAGTFSSTVVDTSVFGQVVDNGTQVYDRTTDSLQAQTDSSTSALLSASVNDATPTASTFKGSSGLSSADDKYKGSFLGFTNGTNQGIYRKVAGYVGATKTFTFDQAFPAAPADTNTFEITGWGGY